MVQKVYEHTIRKISFSADELKRWTKQDELLINAYLKLHDKEALLKAQAKELMNKCGSLNKHTEKVRVNLIDIKSNMSGLIKLADSFILVGLAREKKAAEISEQVSKVNEALQAYSALLNKLDEETRKCSALNSRFADATENSGSWDEYEEIKSKHFDNYQINAIDIMSFDADDDTFRGFVSIWGDTNKTIIDNANSAIDNYNKLMLETETQYAIWEEFLKRFALIHSIVESNAGELTISVN